MNNLTWAVATLCFFLCHPAVRAASLSLSPTSLNLETGQQANLTLHLDPQGAQVIGSDIILSYPTNFKVISVVNTQVFPGNPATIIDNDHGTTKFSLINNFGVYQTAPADIATITVAGVTAGSGNFNLVMTPGDTKDTNVVIPGGVDVLTAVTGAGLTITNPPGQPDPTAAPTPTPTLNPIPAASVTLPPQASDVARANLAKTRPPGAADTALKNQASSDFLSPLASPVLADADRPANVPGKTLGVTTDLHATTTQARSLLIFLLPSFCMLLGIIFLVSALRHPHTFAQVQVTPAYVPSPVYQPPARQSLEHPIPNQVPTITYYHP